MLLTELRRVLESGPARPRSPGKDVWLLDTGPWWRLFTDFRRLEDTKVALLAAAWRLPCPLYFSPEEPLPQELAPFLRREGTAWRVDTSKPAEAFYRVEPVSGLGNWQLYAANQPTTAAAPDTFRVSSDEVLAFMGSHNIFLLIDVFHDDTDWCIALQEPADGQSVA